MRLRFAFRQQSQPRTSNKDGLSPVQARRTVLSNCLSKNRIIHDLPPRESSQDSFCGVVNLDPVL